MVAFEDVGAADFDAARPARGLHPLRLTVNDGLAWLQAAMPKAAWRMQPDGSAFLPYGDFAPLAIACARLPPAGFPARTVVRESLLDSALHRYWQVVVPHLPGGYVGRSFGVLLEMLAALSNQLGDAASVMVDADFGAVGALPPGVYTGWLATLAYTAEHLLDERSWLLPLSRIEYYAQARWHDSGMSGNGAFYAYLSRIVASATATLLGHCETGGARHAGRSACCASYSAGVVHLA